MGHFHCSHMLWGPCKQSLSPTDISKVITRKNLTRCGAQAPGCFLPKGSWGQLSKSAILASKLLTPGPKPLLWSVLEQGHSIVIAFLPKTSLACVVVECQCFPTNTCLQCPTCVSIQEGHFYSSRLVSALVLEFPTKVEKTSRCV